MFRIAVASLGMLAIAPLHAFDLASWIGGDFGNKSPAAAKLSAGFQIVQFDSYNGVDDWNQILQIVENESVVHQQNSAQAGFANSAIPKNIAKKAVANPALGSKVGYFSKDGSWKTGRITGYKWTANELNTNGGSYALFPMVDGRWTGPLITESKIVEGTLGTPKLTAIKKSDPSQRDALKKIVSKFLFEQAKSGAIKCEGVTGTACVTEVLGEPPDHLEAVEKKVSFLMELSNSKEPLKGSPWHSFGDASCGIVLGIQAKKNFNSAWDLTFFVRNGIVDWTFGMRTKAEILQLGQRWFVRQSGCTPSSDGCDSRVMEWYSDGELDVVDQDS